MAAPPSSLVVGGGAWKSAFLISFQVMGLLLVPGSHFENRWDRMLGEGFLDNNK